MPRPIRRPSGATSDQRTAANRVRARPCPVTLLLAGLGLLAACGGAEEELPSLETPAPDWTSTLGAEERVVSLAGFAGPESVRYDPEQDVWFVANFNGDSGARDGNGFVSRVDASADTVEALRFATGTEAVPLHAARGMYLTGDTLWVADIDGVHGFHRETGEPVAFVDLTPFEPGFLNDISGDDQGTLYVTDTDRSAIYALEAGAGQREVMEVVADTALGSPNGIVRDEARGGWVLMPWSPGHPLRLWSPESGAEAQASPLGEAFGPETTPGRMDGAELLDGRLLVASQTDSTLRLLDPAGASLRPYIRLVGAPADPGLDTRRRRVAVPFVGLDRVDIWELPPAGDGASGG